MAGGLLQGCSKWGKGQGDSFSNGDMERGCCSMQQVQQQLLCVSRGSLT